MYVGRTNSAQSEFSGQIYKFEIAGDGPVPSRIDPMIDVSLVKPSSIPLFNTASDSLPFIYNKVQVKWQAPLDYRYPI